MSPRVYRPIQIKEREYKKIITRNPGVAPKQTQQVLYFNFVFMFQHLLCGREALTLDTDPRKLSKCFRWPCTAYTQKHTALSFKETQPQNSLWWATCVVVLVVALITHRIAAPPGEPVHRATTPRYSGHANP